MTWRRVRRLFARYVQLGVFGVAILFGMDYWATPVGTSGALTAIEQTWIPLWIWGATISAAGLAGLLVEWRILGDDHPILVTDTRWRWGWVTNSAHGMLCALFVALAGSSLFDVLMRGIDEGKWYGWRTGVMWAGFAALNYAFVPRAKGTVP